MNRNSVNVLSLYLLMQQVLSMSQAQAHDFSQNDIFKMLSCVKAALKEPGTTIEHIFLFQFI